MINSRAHSMNWSCDRDGCFNNKHRPRLEVFADCFPRNISMGDIDGFVEVCGSFLFMEFKSFNKEMPNGQMRGFKALTVSERLVTFLVVEADCETMQVYRVSHLTNGIQSGFVPTNLDGLKGIIKEWVSTAENGYLRRQLHREKIAGRQSLAKLGID